MADRPEVMQASGWDYDKDGNVYQGDPNSPGASALSKSLKDIAFMPLMDMGMGLVGELAMSVPVVRRAVTAFDVARELNRNVSRTPGWFVTESRAGGSAPLLREYRQSIPVSSADYSPTHASGYAGHVQTNPGIQASRFVEDVDEAVRWASERGAYADPQFGIVDLYPKDYIGDGAEMYVYSSRTKPGEVLKLQHGSAEMGKPVKELPNFKTPEEAYEYGLQWLAGNNNRPYNFRMNLVGVSDNGAGGFAPVYSQPKATIAKNNTIAVKEKELKALAQRIGDRASKYSAYPDGFPQEYLDGSFVQPPGTARTNAIVYENDFNVPLRNPFTGEYVVGKDFDPRNVGMIRDANGDRVIMGVDLKRRGGLLDRLNKHYNGDRSKIIQAMQYARGGFKRDAATDAGDQYYDIVRQRRNSVFNALMRSGMSANDAARLAPMIVTQQTMEGGWVLNRKDNNYGGMKSAGKTIAFDSEDDFQDAYIKMLDSKWHNGRAVENSWRSARDLDDWARILNREDLGLSTKEAWEKYNRGKQGNDFVYLYAPQWENNNKPYREHLKKTEDRTAAYLKMVEADEPYSSLVPKQEQSVAPVATPKKATTMPGMFQALIPTSVQKLLNSRDAGGLLLTDYASGGSIHIAPSKKGTFTAAAKKHGKSVQAFASQVLANKENYSPAMIKKANFARNAAKWHADGGLIERYGIDKVRAAMQKVKR